VRAGQTYVLLQDSRARSAVNVGATWYTQCMHSKSTGSKDDRKVNMMDVPWPAMPGDGWAIMRVPSGASLAASTLLLGCHEAKDIIHRFGR